MKVVGLISGSSLDGLDIALCEFDGLSPDEISWSCLRADTVPFPAELIERLRKAVDLSGRDLMSLECDFSRFCVQAVRESLQDHAYDLVCSHGHTVFHHPEESWTLQIGDGAMLAEELYVPAITNVRGNDMVLGGQGAPVAPIIERWLIPGHDYYLNLGGISNLSIHKNGFITSFDSGPCNQVLNTWIAEIGLAYDDRGQLAATGKANSRLIERWAQLPYFHERAPKSLDNSWVHDVFLPLTDRSLSLPDRLATMVSFIGVQLRRDLEMLDAGPGSLLVTGGGAHNDFMVEAISSELQKLGISVVLPASLMIDFKEAILISLMGYLRYHQLPNTLKTVTGARKDSISGALYIPS
ncbi:MAG: anhydro-N-acetylmuramic acid kinase [Bacteroidota bacterium]